MVARAYNAGNPAGHEGRKKERGAGPRYPVGSPHPSSSAASFGESRAWTVGGEKRKAEAEEAGNGKVMSELQQPPEPPGVNVGWFNAKQAVEITTKAVTDDEPCFFLGEFNLPSRSGKTRVRYQILRVVRNDHLETAYVYLGPASSFHADEFTMLGGTVNDYGKGEAVHTVAELRDGAERIRNEKLHREQRPSDLQGAFRNYTEEKGRRRKKESTFGYHGQIVRA